MEAAFNFDKRWLAVTGSSLFSPCRSVSAVHPYTVEELERQIDWLLPRLSLFEPGK